MSSTTPLMNLTLPDVGPGGTPGPTYAQNINDDFSTLDSHNHAPGSGALVPVAGININADLSLGSTFNLTNARAVRVVVQAATLATANDKNEIYSVLGDLYWNNNSGVAVKITNGTGINITGVAGFYGDYAQPGVPAAATYSNTTKTFVFTQSSGVTAIIAASTYQLSAATASANSINLKSPAGVGASYDFVFPAAAPSVASRLEISTAGQVSFVNKNIGQVPLGGVIATFPNLTGAYVTTATTVADANGFVLCNGQTLADPTSTMNGDVIPNLNNAVFVMGDVTANAGVAGGSNSALLFHAHIMDHGHGNTFAVSSANAPHAHGGATGNNIQSLSHFHNITDPGHNHQIQSFYTAGGGNNGPGAVFNDLNIFLTNTVGNVPTGITINPIGDIAHTHTIQTDNTTHTHAMTGGVTNLTASTGNAGSGGDSRPKYITATYIMRVK